jgi:tetratricopeptide (TPR) repeat protein
MKKILFFIYNKFYKKNTDHAWKEFYGQAIKHEKARQYEEAIKYYEKALEINNNLHDACFKIAEFSSCYCFDHLKAIKYYFKAIKIKPKCLDTHTNLIYEFMDLSKRSHGKHIALKQEEDLYWKAWKYTVGDCDNKKAIKTFKEALNINKKSVLSFAKIGLIYKDMGDSKESIKYFTKSIKCYHSLMPRDSILRLYKE